MIRVLVTGAGGVFGEAIIRSLIKSKLVLHIVAADCNAYSSGFFLADDYCLFPKANDKTYKKHLINFCVKKSIDIVFIGSGKELSYICKYINEIESKSNTVIIANSHEVVKMTNDKWLTYKFIKNANFPVPESTISTNSNELNKFANRVGYPLIVKPRVGKGSKGILFCNNHSELLSAMSSGVKMIAQELIGSIDDEFTVGVLGNEEGAILGSIILKRYLGKNGMTLTAKTVRNEEISFYCESLVKLIKPKGYCNIQLRIKDDVPYAFEINGRVSSSTGFRTLAGFNEAEILIRHYILKESKIINHVDEINMLRINSEIPLNDSTLTTKGKFEL